MKRNVSRLIAATAACVALIVLDAGPAAAHEDRLILGEKYELTAGWGDEPTFTGFKNSVTLRIREPRAGDKPVAGLKDIEVEVKTGSEAIDLTLDQAFGEPGLYEATLVPTRAGTYTFTFTGEINGQPFDETFTSGEDTFDAPKEPTEVQFPAKDPSPGDLAERLDRDSARLAAAKDDASSANTLGIAGIVLGALGLIVGGVALTRKR